MDNAGVQPQCSDQHRPAAVRGGHGLPEHSGPGRVARRPLPGTRIAATQRDRFASLLLAPLGSHGVNLAAITAAICTGPQAHEDASKRYTAAVFCGLFYALAGLFGASLVALFAALPKALLLSVAAIALFGSIGNGLQAALHHAEEREAALLTFMLTASGISLGGIGSGLLGLLLGWPCCGSASSAGAPESIRSGRAAGQLAAMHAIDQPAKHPGGEEHDETVDRRRNGHGRVVQQRRTERQGNGQRAVVNTDLHADGNRLFQAQAHQTRYPVTHRQADQIEDQRGQADFRGIGGDSVSP